MDGNENIGLRPARGICNGCLLSISLWAIIGGAVLLFPNPIGTFLNIIVGVLFAVDVVMVIGLVSEIRNDRRMAKGAK